MFSIRGGQQNLVIFGLLWTIFALYKDTNGKTTSVKVDISTTIDEKAPSNPDVVPNEGNDSSKAYHGLKNKESRDSTKIVGGHEAIPHSLPWQAFYRVVRKNGERFRCGAVIICSFYVVTAAHCNENVDQSRSEIVTGLHDVTNLEPSAMTHRIVAINDHPEHRSLGQSQDFDISILKISPAVRVDFPEMRAVFLPTREDTSFPPDTKFYISGWGANRSDGPAQEKLMVAKVPWISPKVCKTAYAELKNGKFFPITESMICAGKIENGGTDSCQGDSGGPMVWLDPKSEKVKLVGIVSFGYLCAEPNAPGVYARVSSVLDWMMGVMGNCNAAVCSMAGPSMNFCSTKSNTNLTWVDT